MPSTSTASPILAVSELRKTYPTKQGSLLVLDGISLNVARGEILTLVGPSGCGKTTLLRCIAGLTEADQGGRTLDGQPLDGIPPRTSIVFQEYNRSLFPWLSVEGNVRFPLKGHSRKEQAARCKEALTLVGLSGFEHHYPWQLSGGMQQRVGIARAIASQPELLLMDEPFASVDAQTRIVLEDMLLAIWREYDLSIVLVTHDIEEAVYLADRVVVLSGRPTKAITEIATELGRPRDQLTTKSEGRFIELRREILTHIRRAVT
jgi:NitT/TauT family transport system ATP-binding protein